MISTMQYGATLQPPMQKGALSSEQSSKLTELLGNYDSDNLSEDDAKSLVSSIKELGIKPGEALKEALGAAGIDARDLGNKAGLGGPPGGGGPGGAGGPPGGGKGGGGPGGAGGPGGGGKGADSVDEAIVSLVKDAREAYQSSDDEDVSFADILSAKLEESGYDPSQPSIDFYA